MALVTFDPDAKAMYISLNDRKAIVAKTIPLGEGKYLDVTDANEPVGLEIILPSEIPKEAIDAIVNRSKSTIQVL